MPGVPASVNTIEAVEFSSAHILYFESFVVYICGSHNLVKI